MNRLTNVQLLRLVRIIELKLVQLRRVILTFFKLITALPKRSAKINLKSIKFLRECDYQFGKCRNQFLYFNS